VGRFVALVSEGALPWAVDLSTLVTVGNATQAFDRLLDGVRSISRFLPRPIVVQRGVSRADDSIWETHDFLPMGDFERLIRESSVLIMHAGAGSVIHAVRSGNRPIVMPRRMHLGELVDDHQVEFAQAMALAGYVRLAMESSDLAREIASTEGGGSPSPAKLLPPLVQRVSALLDGWSTHGM
jgi:UDP-N-acetylglucosamine transferase subunit ALG13